MRFFIENGLDGSKASTGYGSEFIGSSAPTFSEDPQQLARRMARRIDNILYGLKR